MVTRTINQQSTVRIHPQMPIPSLLSSAANNEKKKEKNIKTKTIQCTIYIGVYCFCKRCSLKAESTRAI